MLCKEKQEFTAGVARGILKDRQRTAETLLEIKRGEPTETGDAQPAQDEKPEPQQSAPALKRYRND